jgi:hypothetical protein
MTTSQLLQPRGRSPQGSSEPAPGVYFICAADVKGALTGQIGRCGAKYSGGSCPYDCFHVPRPVPFSLRSVQGGPKGFYFTGVRRFCQH